MVDEPGYARDPGGDDGNFHRHRLEHDIGQAFAETAQHENVHRLVEGYGLCLVTDEPDAILAPFGANQAGQMVLLISLAGDPQFHVETLLEQPVHRRDQQVESFLLGEPSDSPDEESICAHPQSSLGLLAIHSPGELPGINGVLDQKTTFAGNAAIEAALEQVVRYADH